MFRLAENSSDVRQHFSEFLDSVVRDRPSFVKRNRDMLVALNLEHLGVLVDAVQFHAFIEKDENGELIGTIEEIDDIIVIGATTDEVIDEIAKEIMEYAEEYLTDSFRLYFNSPNRRKHLPYVMKVAMQNNFADVKRLIHA